MVSDRGREDYGLNAFFNSQLKAQSSSGLIRGRHGAVGSVSDS